MGSEATHYIVIGVAITDKEQVKEFFHLSEDKYDLMDSYNDNGYDEAITPSATGLHVIADGMNCKYVVVGKIVAKGIYNGLGFNEIETNNHAIKDAYREIYPAVKELDEKLGTQFGGLDARVIVFTHWH